MTCQILNILFSYFICERLYCICIVHVLKKRYHNEPLKHADQPRAALKMMIGPGNLQASLIYLQRSGLREKHHRGPIKGIPKTLRTLRLFGIEELKGSP